jgi:hypothetical protein
MSTVIQNCPDLAQIPTLLSEILPLRSLQTNLICFRLSPEVEREIGNRLSWRFRNCL